MLHDFVGTYLNKNASTEAFQEIVEKHMTPALNLEGNGHMDWFFREWVYGTDLPSYRLEYSLSNEPDGKVLFKGTVTESGVPERFTMAVPLYFDFDGHINRAGSVQLHGNQTTKEFRIRLPQRPKKVMLNEEFDVLAENVVVKENERTIRNCHLSNSLGIALSDARNGRRWQRHRRAGCWMEWMSCVRFRLNDRPTGIRIDGHGGRCRWFRGSR